MSCTQRCFDIGEPSLIDIEIASDQALKPSMITEEQHEATTVATAAVAAATTTKGLYATLQETQTRLICLPPIELSRSLPAGHGCNLSVDLIVVDLIGLDDAVIHGTTETVIYDALSYTWGSGEAKQKLHCNGILTPITSNLAAALTQLQPLHKPRYLWVDALCINQTDGDEKARQVAQMLKIFQRARLVVAWVGVADRDSAFAIHCLENNIYLRTQVVPMTDRSHANADYGPIVRYDVVAHSQKCLDTLHSIYEALVGFYARPWLHRSWIRQEVYAARRLEVHCGPQQVSWSDFVTGRDLLEATRTLLQEQSNREVGWGTSRERNIFFVLSEASQNSSGAEQNLDVKTARSLTEVLRHSKYFEATKEEDVIYSVLGMCGVPTSAGSNHIPSNDHNAIYVDYSRSISQIYHDAAKFILNDCRDLSELARMWHSYTRSPRHHHVDPVLPSWAVDWSTGIVDELDIQAIHVALWYHSWDWLPLRRVDDGDWQWPCVSTSNCSQLHIKGRVLNYVAYLSEYTCDLNSFLSGDHGFKLGSAGLSIHTASEPGHFRYLFAKIPAQPTIFDNQRHAYRLAILGVANDRQIALVPSSASKGDLVVAIGPQLLSFVIHPIQDDGISVGLFPSVDLYEQATFSRARRRLSELAISSGLIEFFKAVIFYFLIFDTIGLACWLIWLFSRAIEPSEDTSGDWIWYVVGSSFFGTQLLVVLCVVGHYIQQAARETARAKSVELVFEHLDNAASRLGNEYRFLGPTFVRQLRKPFSKAPRNGLNLQRPLQDFVLQ